MSAMMKIAIAALAAGIAQAKPVNVASGPNAFTKPSNSWSSSSSIASSSSTSYATGSSNSGSQTTGFPEFVSATAVPSAVAALAKEINADLTQVDRLQQLLSVDNESKVPLTDPKAVHDAIAFDFKTAPVGGDGGRILVANEANFPFLVGEGIAGAVAFIEPCGMNSPHTHPLLPCSPTQFHQNFVLTSPSFSYKYQGSNLIQIIQKLTILQALPCLSLHI
jgi:hypothetical protein